MKKICISAFLATLILTGCGSSSSSSNTQKDAHEHGEDKRALIFYSGTSNDHFAYSLEEKELTNLNDAKNSEGEDISNFNLTAAQKGKPFIWVDDKGDADEDNDEQKIVMFKEAYKYSTDGDATSDDFYYLGHFHEEEENGKTHHHLAAHASSEFAGVTSGAKFEALKRLNAYLKAQDTLGTQIDTKLKAETDANGGLCGFIKYENHEEKKELYFAMAKNGKLYVYDKDLNQKIDDVTISSSCSEDNMGLSTTEEGVWVYIGGDKKISEVDSHDDGVYHVHETMDLSKYIGDGKDAKFMVSLVPAQEHEH